MFSKEIFQNSDTDETFNEYNGKESDFEKEYSETNEKSDLERERERNIRKMHQFVFADDPEGLERALASIQDYSKSINGTAKSLSAPKKRRSHKDRTVTFNYEIPLQRRKSLRIAKIEPIHYNKLDFENEPYDDEIENLEKVIFRPRIRINTSSRPSVVNYIPVEDVTPEYLAKIAKSSTKKVYSQNGTSCHQCRQKTLDSKTVCRSGRCFGVRGQFCGPCLKNRYGEDAATVLLDPNWQCPGCRDRCNCSFCRKRKGKRPTGILAPIAQRQGYRSVDEFLQSLNGIGDNFENSHDEETPDDLLGFDDFGKPVVRELQSVKCEEKDSEGYKNDDNDDNS
ncbi:cell division cycle-associated protein 7 [Agrilus planipennis]|uniref:Cell division cycle-associated protein 7 n=1 Tax=Agrilus planipennis TaxID=224129 RepID=A0A1W4WLJ8_AGRPL|nr:cell division cycle-associated protein 7 [Agrilus planipennis]